MKSIEHSAETQGYVSGTRVRWNYWSDRRESGWQYGTIVRGPFRMFTEIGYTVLRDAIPQAGIPSFEGDMSSKLLEPVPKACPDK